MLCQSCEFIILNCPLRVLPAIHQAYRYRCIGYVFEGIRLNDANNSSIPRRRLDNLPTTFWRYCWFSFRFNWMTMRHVSPPTGAQDDDGRRHATTVAHLSAVSEHSQVITGCQACADAAKVGVAETPVDEETATAATIGIKAKTRPVTYAL